MKNYYDILEITPDASKLQIKEAYRKLAKKYHPDKNDGNDDLSDLLKDVNEAKEVLCDKIKKLEYDQELSQYKLSHIFNPHQHLQAEEHVKSTQQQQKFYKQEFVTRKVWLASLFVLLAIFMFYLFPIHNNEWEIAHQTERFSDKGLDSDSDVDDLFGRGETSRQIAYTESKQDQQRNIEQSKTIDVTGPEVIHAPKVVEQGLAVVGHKAAATNLPKEVSKVEPAKPKLSVEMKTVTDPAPTVVQKSIALSVPKLAERIIASPGVKAVKKTSVMPTQNVVAKTTGAAPNKTTSGVLKISGETVSNIAIESSPMPVKKSTVKQLSEAAMLQVLTRVELQKDHYSNRLLCIQIAKTSTSNVYNAFMIADFFNRHGYTISGRKIISGSSKGISVDVNKSGCSTVTIGSL